MACLNCSYSETGISTEARTLLKAAWQKNTSSGYGAAWQKWASWCKQQQINPISAPLSAILDFHTYIHTYFILFGVLYIVHRHCS